MADPSTAPSGTAGLVHAEVATAALNRASIANKPPQDDEALKSEVHKFNAHVNSIQDFQHHRAEDVLDAIQLIQKICSDIETHKGKSPKDPSIPLSIKRKLFDRKTHSLPRCQETLFALGFKEQVVDLEGRLVYHAKFADPLLQAQFLTKAAALLVTAVKSVSKHTVSATSLAQRRAAEERRRAEVRSKIEDDREAQLERRHRLAEARMPQPPPQALPATGLVASSARDGGGDGHAVDSAGDQLGARAALRRRTSARDAAGD